MFVILEIPIIIAIVIVSYLVSKLKFRFKDIIGFGIIPLALLILLTQGGFECGNDRSCSGGAMEYIMAPISAAIAFHVYAKFIKKSRPIRFRYITIGITTSILFIVLYFCAAIGLLGTPYMWQFQG